MYKNKGFAPIIAIIIAVVIIAGGIGGYLYIKNKNNLPIVPPLNNSTSTSTIVTSITSTTTPTSTDKSSKFSTPYVWVTGYSPDVRGGDDFVTKLNSIDGSTIGTYSVEGWPIGIAVDASGNVWVTNQGMTILSQNLMVQQVKQ
jgi:hypothetical protein